MHVVGGDANGEGEEWPCSTLWFGAKVQPGDLERYGEAVLSPVAWNQAQPSGLE